MRFTRKEAALNQINLAIRLFHEGEFAGGATILFMASSIVPLFVSSSSINGTAGAVWCRRKVAED
ncbi:MAG: hypothetical protein EOR81_19470 [Mesorhizobium sp.]|nr:MAG: hypothetical protein EOR81_19470 [Mesorhizobium sp.]